LALSPGLLFAQFNRLGGKQLCPESGGGKNCVLSTDKNGNAAIPTTVLGPKTIGAGENQLPAAAAGNAGWITRVTDAANRGDCRIGGGNAVAICLSNGAAWSAIGGPSTTWVGYLSLQPVAAGATVYAHPPSNTFNAKIGFRSWISPVSCTAHDLIVRSTTAMPVGEGGTTATLMINGAPSALTVSWAAGEAATTKRDSAHLVPIAVGDSVSLRFVNANGSDSGFFAEWSVACGGI